MRWPLLALALGFPAWAQTFLESQAASVEKQRASILKQVTGVTGKPVQPPGSFFAVPWIESVPPSAIASAPCDAMRGEDLDRLIDENSKREGVKADLIRAVIDQESGKKPCAVSTKGAQGLMQLMPATAAQFNVQDAFDPKQNVEAGTKLLKQLLAKYNGDVTLTLSAYNAGAGRVDQEGGVPSIPETMKYVTSILAKLPKR